MPLSFRILGPLEVREDDRELPLGTGRQRALLGLLLVHANELVSADRLIDELWSGRPPPSAQKALQGYVSQLRRVLPVDTILTRNPGYVLTAGDSDAGEFEQLIRLASDQPAEEAVRTFEEALSLWRGRAFEEFEYEDWPQLEIARLEELRLAATEQRVDAELELGHHAQLVPELETLVADHPLREQLRGQLMIALYRSGRQAEALDAYRRGRRLLQDELGLEPSPFLAGLERQILSHDAALAAPTRRGLPVGTVTVLLTDVEGSTRLLKQLGDRYAGVLGECQRLLRDAARRCGGREVDSQGDSFFFAFASAKSALAAAVVAQRELAEHEWPEGAQVRVRMGLHTSEPSVGEERYVGLGVHRAARIGAAAHGGQVLLSGATRELTEDEVGGVSVRPLGTYRLKDFDRPEPLYQLDIDGLQTAFPPLSAERVREPRPVRRRELLLGLAAAALAGVAALAFIVAGQGGSAHKLLPDSVIRIDPKTLKATQVAQVGDGPDLIIASGGFLWVTNNVLRNSSSSDIRNGGDLTLTRVDPATGRTVSVGQVSPCGLTADPSGDVWVANCYAKGSGKESDVVRIAPRTRRFIKTLTVPGGEGYFRGVAYGGGFLWLSDSRRNSVFQVDPDTGAQRPIRLAGEAGSLAWSGGYGDLWIANFDNGNLERLDEATGTPQTIDSPATNPDSVVVDGKYVWVGDWSQPQVVRTAAVGPPNPHRIRLPVRHTQLCPRFSCVWRVAAGAGAIWATTPVDRALWRIDPNTFAVRRIGLPYPPTGVTADADDVWVTVRRGVDRGGNAVG